jgi:isopentenyldiphosphate isomerase
MRLNYNWRMNDALPRGLSAAMDARYRQLAKQIQQLPPVGSRPLTVSGKVAGWITAKACVAVAGIGGVRIEDEAVHITGPASSRRPLNDVLAQVASTLKAAGCLRGWRDELLDVFGEGRRLGVIERAAVRPLGLLTKAVHLNAWSGDGRLWVARRALTKTTDPGLWDTLVGGLAGAGETLENTLLRESNEEAGLAPADMQRRSPLRIILRMHRRLPEGYQVEDALASDCILADDAVPANQDGEVSEIRLLDPESVWQMMEAGEFTHEAELVILEGFKRRANPPAPAARRATSP